MSTRDILDAIHALDGYGLVQTDSDEELEAAIDELALADDGSDQ